MIVAALLFAVLQQQGEAFAQLTVRNGSATSSVPVVLMSAPMIRGDLLAIALGGELRPLGADKWELRVLGTQFELGSGTPFVRTGDEVTPLSAEPVVRGGKLYVPYQFVTEVLPRLATNVAFDAGRGELRLLAAPPPQRTRDVAPTPSPAPPPTTAAPRTTEVPRPRARRLVIVDAGHGGPDKGMTGPLDGSTSLREKDVTLAVARELRRALQDRGVDVVMTRDADTLIALDDRGRIANQRKGDIFVSIHVNAANPRWRDPRGARGFETYYLSEAKTEDERRVEQMENEVVKYEVDTKAGKSDPLSFILHDMEQNEHLRESSRLADVVQKRLGSIHPGPNRGVKQAGFRVLVTALMPAVLVEIGFGTNGREAAWLNDAARQREIASTLAAGALEYLDKYERRSNAGAAASASGGGSR